MPIQLRTGLPGAGKTLGAVEHLIQLRHQHPDRPVKVLGIPDLRDDLAEVITPEQFRDWDQFPAGTIIVVDEVQKYCPARRVGDAPTWIAKLSEHRHLGLEFIFITQHPSLLDTYVRRLVDRHIHTVRKFGTYWVTRFEWPECQSDPTSKSALRDVERKDRSKYSKVAMSAYTSSELHTVKRRIPPFVWVSLALLLIIPGLLGAAYLALRSRGKSEAALIHPDQHAHSMFSGSSNSVMSTDDWIKRMTPRVKGVPWSAPLFDGQSVMTVPDLRCIVIERDSGLRDCKCYSEQDTPIDVDQKMCYKAASEGVYNPFRPALQDARQAQPAASSSARSVADARHDDAEALGELGGGAYQGRQRATAYGYIPPTYGKWNSTPLKSGTGM
ncbi:zonular occludens toxin domain-containing protein [Dyella acidiphila]|uniref:Zona occludens toxin N-terminal domain-containing protein n=1 Tax=Dyella acidiphila TaxID=2775866 RepID=A0ABR9GG59_9GAMM|nr:zonular occludens toxin domain-containing protein [Dyella acidiphila]MBE1163035.1 hypothetical protein [Dyella acidiphila]